VWVLVAVIVGRQIGIFSRMISASALMSALPKPSDRAQYMSVSASLQQVAGGVAAVVGLIVAKTPGAMYSFRYTGATFWFALRWFPDVNVRYRSLDQTRPQVVQPLAGASPVAGPTRFRALGEFHMSERDRLLAAHDEPVLDQVGRIDDFSTFVREVLRVQVEVGRVPELEVDTSGIQRRHGRVGGWFR